MKKKSVFRSMTVWAAIAQIVIAVLPLGLPSEVKGTLLLTGFKDLLLRIKTTEAIDWK